MTDESDLDPIHHSITPEELMRSALADKLETLKDYESVIWKIRSGYIVILYGGLTFLIGKEGDALPQNIGAAFFLALGLSMAAFWTDFSYVRKKLKIIAARDALIKLICSKQPITERVVVKQLLLVAGETLPNRLHSEVRRDYAEKLWWNVRSVLFPIYSFSPILGLFLWIYHLVHGYFFDF
jgi:hypothetical protein